MVKILTVIKVIMQNRIFLLGLDHIKEKSEYEHVGIKACIYPYDGCIIEARLKKARRVFNASMGIAASQ